MIFGVSKATIERRLAVLVEKFISEADHLRGYYEITAKGFAYVPKES